jgi:hypothetical protein
MKLEDPEWERDKEVRKPHPALWGSLSGESYSERGLDPELPETGGNPEGYP